MISLLLALPSPTLSVFCNNSTVPIIRANDGKKDRTEQSPLFSCEVRKPVSPPILPLHPIILLVLLASSSIYLLIVYCPRFKSLSCRTLNYRLIPLLIWEDAHLNLLKFLFPPSNFTIYLSCILFIQGYFFC